jgi:glycosyltransferase involved in cell wall biosynthesis
MRLSVIIPSYNEEKRLPKTLAAIEEYLKNQNYDYEIIVVNDGSKDNTAQVVENLKSQITNLHLIDNKVNHGKGYVVRQGMLAAQGEYRLFTDADNSTSIDQVENMWPWFEKGYDIVIGSRDITGAKIPVPQPWYRRKIGDVFNLMVQVLAGLWGIWDTQCGFKGFTAKAAQDIFSKTKIDGFAFDVEVLVLAKKLGYKVKEIPVTWINDPESRVKFKHIFKMLQEILKIRWDLIRHRYD